MYWEFHLIRSDLKVRSKHQAVNAWRPVSVRCNLGHVYGIFDPCASNVEVTVNASWL